MPISPTSERNDPSAVGLPVGSVGRASLPATESAGLPKDSRTGLTLPLRTFLGSQALDKHRATLAIELEVLAKKFDRFGWARDMGTPVHDRLIMDWMDALQDYPLDEVKAACRKCVLDDPKHMPNEGSVMAKIMDGRRRYIAPRPRMPEPHQFQATDIPVEERRRAGAEIMARAGYRPKDMGGEA